MNGTQEAQADKVVTLRLQEALIGKVDEAARVTGLKKSDVIRLAIDRGVDVLLSQLNANTEEGASK